MKKIIVATDYSAEAENAARYAASAASEHGYELILFNVSDISIHALNAGLSAGAIDEALEIFKKNIKDAAHDLSATYKVPVTPYLSTGNFYSELITCINKYAADGLVMGMAGKSIEQDMLGNTTTAAIHRLQIPIMAVPLAAKFGGIKKVLFACDLKRGVNDKVLKHIRSIAEDFGATVEVFYVENAIAALQEVSEPVDTHIGEALSGISYYYKNIQSNKIIRAIQDEMKATQPDLLIMAPYIYGFWDSVVHRSKTRMMAAGINIPLLSLPEIDG
jgi:nucleotide-binding universal stress UspA family protein